MGHSTLFAIRSFFEARKEFRSMRAICAGAVFALTMAHPALANTIVFGGVSDLSACARNGPTADRDCRTLHSVSNGVLDDLALANFLGEASADDGSVLSSGNASADLHARFAIPYTVMRTVQVNPAAGGAIASFPIQQISFDLGWDARVATVNSGAGGDQLAQSLDITLSSQEASFPDLVLLGSVTCSGNCSLPNFIPLGSAGRSHTTSVNLSGPTAPEISAIIPSDYRAWEDFVSPFAADYGTPFTVTQSYTGNLLVEFRLFAESTSDAFGNGGEAIACAGLKSGLSSFGIDDTLDCGSGLTLEARTTVIGTGTQVVPEPTTALLVGLGLLGLAIAGRRQ